MKRNSTPRPYGHFGRLKLNQTQFLRFILLPLIGGVFLSSCSTLDSALSPDQKSSLVDVSPAPGTSTASDGAPAPLNVKTTGFEYRGQKIPETQYDLPVEMNPAVAKWIDYFTGRGRDRFARYLERSEYFIPFIKPILKSTKAPEDLVYLALIESGFNNHANSVARAVGAWQFIAPTGRRYGLEVSWWIDQRRDVLKSTLAAVRYLKDLHQMFNSWHLAAAAYNAGEMKIVRAIRMYGTKDFWELSDKKRKYLRPETKNYVPKMFAAAIIGKNRKFFGFEESYTGGKLRQVGRDGVGVVDGAEIANAEIEKLPDQLETSGNDAPTVEITKASPADPDELALLEEDELEARLKSMSKGGPTPHVDRHGQVAGDVLVEVEIPSPADLFKVASASGLSYAEFKSMNPELRRWVTPPHLKSYSIKVPLSHRDDFVKKLKENPEEFSVSFLEYKPRKGETANQIARKFGISVDPIAQMNQVKPAQSLLSSFLVKLPIPQDFVRSLASLKSLDLLDPASPKKKKRGFRWRKSGRGAAVKSSEVRKI